MTPTRYQRLCNDAKRTAKGFQNLSGALEAFQRFSSELASEDQVLLSALFCHGVTRYAKPFVVTETHHGKVKLGTKHLSKIEGFDGEIHKHLLELRNTLIAHDDLVTIEPQIGIGSLEVPGMDLSIPMEMGVVSKALGYPPQSGSAKRICSHVAACKKGASQRLADLFWEIRQESIASPADARAAAKWTRSGETLTTRTDGPARVTVPDVTQFLELKPTVPDYQHLHEELLYEELKFRLIFRGPVRAEANGKVFVAEPTLEFPDPSAETFECKSVVIRRPAEPPTDS